MNKLLILISFLFIFSLKINAYEFQIYYNPNTIIESQVRYYYYIGLDNRLICQSRNLNNNILNTYNNDFIFYSTLNYIKINQINYVNSSDFAKEYKNNIVLLNDLYVYRLNPFLNYLYNEGRFESNNYILYDNYELLYNSDGLVVESIVNGKWAGLYDGPDQSGYLYDSNGNLAYINGVEPTFFEKLENKLIKPFKFHLESIFIKKIWYSILVFIFAIVILRTVIRMAFQAFLIRFYENKIQRLEKRREKIENA